MKLTSPGTRVRPSILFWAFSSLPTIINKLVSLAVMRFLRRPLAVLALLIPVAWSYDFDRLQQQLIARFGNAQVALLGDWQKLLGSTQSSEQDKLARINSFINQRIVFGSDDDIWNVSDYWSTPLETIGRGQGDCEDFAIIKYFSSKEAGIPLAKLRLVYAKAILNGPNGPYQQAHMVLAYYPTPNAEPLVLDNLINEIKPASQRADLFPVFSFNSEGIYNVAAKTSKVGSTTQLSRWQDLLQRARKEGID